MLSLWLLLCHKVTVIICSVWRKTWYFYCSAPPPLLSGTGEALRFGFEGINEFLLILQYYYSYFDVICYSHNNWTFRRHSWVERTETWYQYKKYRHVKTNLFQIPQDFIQFPKRFRHTLRKCNATVIHTWLLRRGCWQHWKTTERCRDTAVLDTSSVDELTVRSTSELLMHRQNDRQLQIITKSVCSTSL